MNEDDAEELIPHLSLMDEDVESDLTGSINCADCDTEITYSARHWDMVGQQWYCMHCQPPRNLERGWLSGEEG